MSVAENLAGNSGLGPVLIFAGAAIALYMIGRRVSDAIPSAGDIADFGSTALITAGEYADAGLDYIAPRPGIAYAVPFNIAAGLTYVAGSIGEYITDIFRGD
jgi:hypothetical protein